MSTPQSKTSGPRPTPLDIVLSVILAAQMVLLAFVGLMGGLLFALAAVGIGYAALVQMRWLTDNAKLASACAATGSVAAGFSGVFMFVLASCGSIVNCGGREPAYHVLVFTAVCVIADLVSSILLWRRPVPRR